MTFFKSSVIVVLLLTSCRSTPPKINIKWFAGDSRSQALVRRQENRMIFCKDPDFDNYLALSYEDFQELYTKIILGCTSWKKGPKMTFEEAINAKREAESLSKAPEDRADTE